jgi:hypothetical protein
VGSLAALSAVLQANGDVGEAFKLRSTACCVG